MKGVLSNLLADRVVQILDDEGRCLTEQADSGYPPDQEEICPYPDRRLGRPMNRGALQQIGRHWGWTRRHLMEQMPPEATLQEAFQVSLEATSQALLWDQPYPLPARLAALYKACAGFCQVFAWLLLEEDQSGRRKLASLGQSGDFFGWLNAQGWLLGVEQACAGTESQIRSLFDVFCGGLGPPPLPDSPILQAVALQSALSLATYQAARQGAAAAEDCLGHRLLRQGRAPWLFAVTARPEGRPEWARRLLAYPTDSTALDCFLDGNTTTLTHEQREQLFWRASDLLL